MKLYELTNEYLQLVELFSQSGGELTPEIEEALARNQADFTSKIDGYCFLCRKFAAEGAVFQAQFDQLDAEKKFWAAKAQAKENAVRRLKDYMKRELERMGLNKAETELFRVRIQNSPPAIEINVAADALPERFQRVEVKVNTDEIKAAWKAREEMPAGVDVRVGTHLRIE